MDTLLTLSLGEYSAAEIVLRLTVALMTMTALLLALSTACVPQRLRLPLFLSAVSLGGAAWFEAGVWQSWKEGFELAGTSYCVTGQLLADQDRIIAWSLGVPAILFSFGLTYTYGNKKSGPVIQLGIVLLLLALLAAFSRIAEVVLFGYAGVLLLMSFPRATQGKGMTREIKLAVMVLFLSVFFTCVTAWHHFSLGGGVSGELVRGEILRSVIDLFSLVVPALLLLIGVLRLSKADQKNTD